MKTLKIITIIISIALSVYEAIWIYGNDFKYPFWTALGLISCSLFIVWVVYAAFKNIWEGTRYEYYEEV